MSAPVTAVSGTPALRAPVLQAIDVSAGYGPTPVIRGLSLSVAAGERLALLGANGAGKTTTLMGLAGLLPISSGEVRFAGKATKSPLFRRSRQGLAYLPEQRGIFRDLTTMENLRLGRGDPEAALALIPELRRVLARKAGLLSGGEQQMLVLARAMAARPILLLCDELALGLAPVLMDRLLDLLAEAARQGAGMIIVEQHVRAALEFCDRAVVLRRGRLVLEGTREEMMSRLDEIETHYLSAATDDEEGTE
jgi:branched-chain amino acid transport system ATP-binding protein